MGGCRNVVVNFGDTSVALYTHSYDTALPGMLAKALDHGWPRWSDAPYLTRIIFNEMTWNGAAFGIEPHHTGKGDYCRSSPRDIFVYPGVEAARVEFNGEEYTFEEFIQDYIWE